MFSEAIEAVLRTWNLSILIYLCRFVSARMHLLSLGMYLHLDVLQQGEFQKPGKVLVCVTDDDMSR